MQPCGFTENMLLRIFPGVSDRRSKAKKRSGIPSEKGTPDRFFLFCLCAEAGQSSSNAPVYS